MLINERLEQIVCSRENRIALPPFFFFSRLYSATWHAIAKKGPFSLKNFLIGKL